MSRANVILSEAKNLFRASVTIRALEILRSQKALPQDDMCGGCRHAVILSPFVAALLRVNSAKNLFRAEVSAVDAVEISPGRQSWDSRRYGRSDFRPNKKPRTVVLGYVQSRLTALVQRCHSEPIRRCAPQGELREESLSRKCDDSRAGDPSVAEGAPSG